MAWSTPQTFTTGQIVTAADLNTDIRDNILETAPAKAATIHDLFIATAANAIKRWPKGGGILSYPEAGGTATALVVTTGFFTLVDGLAFTFIATADNGGAATTINADGTGVKNLYKPGGTDPPALIDGKAYTVWYDATGDNFFIKADASGDAVAAEVLEGKTFSNDIDTDLTGTMPDIGQETFTPTTSQQDISLGYHDGTGYVEGDADLVAANILGGVTIFGVAGSAKRFASGSQTITSGDTTISLPFTNVKFVSVDTDDASWDYVGLIGPRTGTKRFWPPTESGIKILDFGDGEFEVKNTDGTTTLYWYALEA